MMNLSHQMGRCSLGLILVCVLTSVRAWGCPANAFNYYDHILPSRESVLATVREQLALNKPQDDELSNVLLPPLDVFVHNRTILRQWMEGKTFFHYLYRKHPRRFLVLKEIFAGIKHLQILWQNAIVDIKPVSLAWADKAFPHKSEAFRHVVADQHHYVTSWEVVRITQYMMYASALLFEGRDIDSRFFKSWHDIIPDKYGYSFFLSQVNSRGYLEFDGSFALFPQAFASVFSILLHMREQATRVKQYTAAYAEFLKEMQGSPHYVWRNLTHQNVHYGQSYKQSLDDFAGWLTGQLYKSVSSPEGTIENAWGKMWEFVNLLEIYLDQLEFRIWTGHPDTREGPDAMMYPEHGFQQMFNRHVSYYLPHIQDVEMLRNFNTHPPKWLKRYFKNSVTRLRKRLKHIARISPVNIHTPLENRPDFPVHMDSLRLLDYVNSLIERIPYR